MKLFADIENVYFAGIGGIGMSALARYFLAGGYTIGGYDKTATALTARLEKEGCNITYTDCVTEIPEIYRDKGTTLVIYTPAIPRDNNILNYFRSAGHLIHKRSAILGIISENTRAIAIAGTHGKTSVTTITAHLMKQSSLDCTAFLGGISKNYNSNLLIGEGEYSVMEADEYDRSFLTITPEIALITSMDPDHLEIYGDHKAMIMAYNEFAGRIKKGGKLLVNSSIKHLVKDIEGVSIFTYGTDSSCDFALSGSSHTGDTTSFSVQTPFGEIGDLIWTIPGSLNLVNAVAAISIATIAGVKPGEIRKSIMLFQGVARRFDIRYSDNHTIYIDDYAHLPEELNFLIDSAKQFYKGKKITAAFQPHLFTRTRNHAAAFAKSLDRLDRVFLLPVYPAREEPIDGVSSGLIFEKMNLEECSLVSAEELLGIIKEEEMEVFITVGAGDIDRLADRIVKILEEKKK